MEYILKTIESSGAATILAIVLVVESRPWWPLAFEHNGLRYCVICKAFQGNVYKMKAPLGRLHKTHLAKGFGLFV